MEGAASAKLPGLRPAAAGTLETLIHLQLPWQTDHWDREMAGEGLTCQKTEQSHSVLIVGCPVC